MFAARTVDIHETRGEFNRDLAMIACGRHVALDYDLSAKSATQAAVALSRWLEEYRSKRANIALHSTPGARSVTYRASEIRRE